LSNEVELSTGKMARANMNDANFVQISPDDIEVLPTSPTVEGQDTLMEEQTESSSWDDQPSTWGTDVWETSKNGRTYIRKNIPKAERMVVAHMGDTYEDADLLACSDDTVDEAY